MIKPTVGRVVWFFPSLNDDVARRDNQPFCAHIVYVHNDHLINVAYFDHNGALSAAHSVPLDEDPFPTSEAFATWMPYQKQVASGAVQPTLHAEPKAEESRGRWTDMTPTGEGQMTGASEPKDNG